MYSPKNLVRIIHLDFVDFVKLKRCCYCTWYWKCCLKPECRYTNFSGCSDCMRNALPGEATVHPPWPGGSQHSSGIKTTSENIGLWIEQSSQRRKDILRGVQGRALASALVCPRVYQLRKILKCQWRLELRHPALGNVSSHSTTVFAKNFHLKCSLDTILFRYCFNRL